MKHPYTSKIQPTQHSQLLKTITKNLNSGKLTTTKCKRCSSLLWPPNKFCFKCLCGETELVELSGRGKVFAFTEIMDGAPYGMENQLPYVLAIVELEEGIRMLTRIVGARYEDLKIGQEVVLTTRKIGEENIVPAFRPL